MNESLYSPCTASISAVHYPYGVVMKERTFGSKTRYQFDGKEFDEETETEDYGMRVLDEDLGIFLTIDPLANDYSWNSPYSFSENRVIDGKDLDGKELNLVIQTFDNSGMVQSVNVVSYLDVMGNKVDQNLVDPTTGTNYTGVNTLVMNINPPSGTPPIQTYGSLNNAAGNFSVLDKNANRRTLGVSGNDNTLMQRDLDYQQGGLKGAGPDQILNAPNGNSLADRTPPVTRSAYSLTRRDNVTATFSDASAVLPSDPATTNQIRDVADYLNIYSSRGATVIGNSGVTNNAQISTLPAPDNRPGFLNESGRFIAGGNIGQLKQARANAVSNAIQSRGVPGSRINTVASPTGTRGSLSGRITYR